MSTQPPFIVPPPPLPRATLAPTAAIPQRSTRTLRHRSHNNKEWLSGLRFGSQELALNYNQKSAMKQLNSLLSEIFEQEQASHHDNGSVDVNDNHNAQPKTKKNNKHKREQDDERSNLQDSSMWDDGRMVGFPPGGGKTLIGISTAIHLCQLLSSVPPSPGRNGILCLTPSIQLCHQLIEEWHKMTNFPKKRLLLWSRVPNFPEIPNDGLPFVVFSTYNILMHSEKQMMQRKSKVTSPVFQTDLWKLCILDEAQQFRNELTFTFVAVALLCGRLELYEKLKRQLLTRQGKTRKNRKAKTSATGQGVEGAGSNRNKHNDTYHPVEGFYGSKDCFKLLESGSFVVNYLRDYCAGAMLINKNIVACAKHGGETHKTSEKDFWKQYNQQSRSEQRRCNRARYSLEEKQPTSPSSSSGSSDEQPSPSQTGGSDVSSTTARQKRVKLAANTPSSKQEQMMEEETTTSTDEKEQRRQAKSDAKDEDWQRDEDEAEEDDMDGEDASEYDKFCSGDESPEDRDEEEQADDDKHEEQQSSSEEEQEMHCELEPEAHQVYLEFLHRFVIVPATEIKQPVERREVQVLSFVPGSSELKFYNVLSNAYSMLHRQMSNIAAENGLLNTRLSKSIMMMIFGMAGCLHPACILPDEDTKEDDESKWCRAIAQLYKQQTGEEVPDKTQSSVKVDYILSKIASISAADSTAKIIVFSSYVKFLRILAWHVEQKFGADSFVLFDGRLTNQERSVNLARFRDRSAGTPTIFLASIGCGGTGLNLEVASHLILTQPLWNFAEELQAISRIKRYRQTKQTVIYQPLVGTDPWRLSLITRKRQSEHSLTPNTRHGGLTQLTRKQQRNLYEQLTRPLPVDNISRGTTQAEKAAVARIMSLYRQVLNLDDKEVESK